MEVEQLEQWRAKGDGYRQNVIDSTIGMAILLCEMKLKCAVVQGGSSYSALAMEWWGIDKGTASKFAQIGGNDKLLVAANTLPSSIRTLYQLSRLSDEQIADGIADGTINPGMTHQDAKQYRQPEPVVLVQEQVAPKPEVVQEPVVIVQDDGAQAEIDALKLQLAAKDELLAIKEFEIKKLTFMGDEWEDCGERTPAVERALKYLGRMDYKEKHTLIKIVAQAHQIVYWSWYRADNPNKDRLHQLLDLIVIDRDKDEVLTKRLGRMLMGQTHPDRGGKAEDNIKAREVLAQIAA